MSVETAAPPQLDRLQRWGTIIGVAGLALCAVGAVVNTDAFFRAYLFAWVFWLGLALGSIAVVMMHYLVGGTWGYLLRRLLESGAMMVPLMALLFVPLLFGLHSLYAWARGDMVATSEVLQHRHPYMNVPFFIIRAISYFAVWSALAWCLNRWSREHDRTGDQRLTARLRRFSAGGLIVYVLTISLASVDWLMSLETDFFSTIFGFLIITSQALATFAFAIALASALAGRPPFAIAFTPKRLNDLGSLLLAATMLWAYMAFSQFLIIWSGNLPDENPWYVHRTTGGWRWVTIFLILFHFAVPFAVLIFRGVRSQPQALKAVAAAILGVHLIYMFWLVVPTFQRDGLVVGWLDLAAPIGIGGVWLAVFAWWLKGRPLLPLHEPTVEEALHHA